MGHVLRATIGSLVLAYGLQTSTSVEINAQPEAPLARRDAAIHRRIPDEVRSGAKPFVRTELFFGTARSEGRVSHAEFREFVAREVRPRFPDGLTLLEAHGEFQRKDVTVEEQSFVLILFYPYDAYSQCGEKIQRIREIYKRQFDQDSVLRVDNPDIVWVSF